MLDPSPNAFESSPSSPAMWPSSSGVPDRVRAAHSEGADEAPVLQGKELQRALKKFAKKERQLADMRQKLATVEVQRVQEEAASRQIIDEQKRRIHKLVMKSDRLERKAKIMKNCMFQMKEKKEEADLIQNNGKNQSLIYSFFVGPEEHPLAKDIRLLQEILQNKIREIEVLGTMISAMKESHAQTRNSLEVDKSRAYNLAQSNHAKWLEAIKSNQRLEDELAQLKKSAAQTRAELLAEIKDAKALAKRNDEEAKRIRASLQNKVKYLEARIKATNAFDDTRVEHLNTMNLKLFNLHANKAVCEILDNTIDTLDVLQNLLPETLKISMPHSELLLNDKYRRTLKQLTNETSRDLRLALSQLVKVKDRTAYKENSWSYRGQEKQERSHEWKKYVSRLFSLLYTLLDSLNKIAFTMVMSLGKKKRPQGQKDEEGLDFSDPLSESYRKIQAWLCNASEACSKLAKQEALQTDGCAFVIETLLFCVKNGDFQSSIKSLDECLSRLAENSGKNLSRHLLSILKSLKVLLKSSSRLRRMLLESCSNRTPSEAALQGCHHGRSTSMESACAYGIGSQLQHKCRSYLRIIATVTGQAKETFLASTQDNSEDITADNATTEAGTNSQHSTSDQSNKKRAAKDRTVQTNLPSVQSQSFSSAVSLPSTSQENLSAVEVNNTGSYLCSGDADKKNTEIIPIGASPGENRSNDDDEKSIETSGRHVKRYRQKNPKFPPPPTTAPPTYVLHSFLKQRSNDGLSVQKKRSLATSGLHAPEAWKAKVKEIEKGYNEQMKILGESLHEMSTLYRQAKQKISEQKDDIENLKEQLKTVKATNRRLSKDFALQLQKSTTISETLGLTPAEDNQQLVSALVTPPVASEYS